jgi:ADP-ribose pyrophosphatase YjhB (NUDIX family)
LLGVGAIVFKGDSILLVERAGKPLKGYWSLPGGLVETGETLDEAVRRETLEETGLHVRPLEQFEIFERIIRDAEGRAEYHYVLADYICKVTGGELAAADDANRAAWIKRSRLAELPITEGTLAVIERAYGARGKRS